MPSKITDEHHRHPQEILMVTFTEAAATEMRERLARSLESLAVKPQSAHQETLAQVDAAPIGTLHGFCYQLIRHHFHQLDMDPTPASWSRRNVCTCEETLDALLEELYQVIGTFSRDLRDHMTHREKGREKLVRRAGFGDTPFHTVPGGSTGMAPPSHKANHEPLIRVMGSHAT